MWMHDFKGSSCPDTSHTGNHQQKVERGLETLLSDLSAIQRDRYLDKYLAAMPTIIDYLNIANDLLSFYKEETMKDAMHVHAHASANHLSHLETLQLFAERAKSAFQRVQCLLSSDEPLQQAAGNFLHGYITFHLASKRYRLTELNIPAALEARSLLLERLSSTREAPDCDHDKAEPVQHSGLD
jgi:hypothetical protein